MSFLEDFRQREELEAYAMAKQTRGEKGIRDWKQKLAVLKVLVGAYTQREIFEKVFEAARGNRLTLDYDIDAISDASRKWVDHTPKQAPYTTFFDHLVQKLGCRSGTTGLALLDSSIEKFIEMLPEESRQSAKEAAGIMSDPVVPTGKLFSQQALSPDQFIRVIHKDDFPSMRSGVSAGTIDTRNYYSTADAARTWSDLVSAEEYPTYDHCKAGLTQLMSHPDWKAALAANPPTTAMMLAGGGAPTKDLVLLRALLEQPETSSERITMWLIDVNFYMLAQSQSFLNRRANNLGGHSRVTINYVCADILQLRELALVPNPVLHPGHPVIFTITGGTIGNVSERKFFQSLDDISQQGDLLIVSADTVDDIPQSQLETSLKDKYGHDSMRRFISPGVAQVISEHNLNEPLDSALKRVDVRIKSGIGSRLTDVPESFTVTLSLSVEGREFTLLNSTRYRVQALTNFAEKLGWRLICQVPSPLNQQFRQFAFRRI